MVGKKRQASASLRNTSTLYSRLEAHYLNVASIHYINVLQGEGHSYEWNKLLWIMASKQQLGDTTAWIISITVRR